MKGVAMNIEYDIVEKSKFLEDEGLEPHEYSINFLEKTDNRIKNYQKIKEEYGVDPRETWNLDMQFAYWIFTRCKMYLKEANINLSYHKFDFESKTYTQEEAINQIIEWTKPYLKKYSCSLEEEPKVYADFQKACRLWAVIVPAMWW